MKILIRNTVFILIAVTFSLNNSSAQLTDLGKLLSGGAEDGGKLIQAYLTPFPKAFGATLNSGWYNTAKPHKIAGFDLTFSLNAAFVPDNAKYFDLNNLNLNASSISSGPMSPTFSGSSNGTRPNLVYTESVMGEQVTIAEYTLPQGTGLGFIPAASLQLGIGVPLGTDIIVRYTPELKLGDAGNMGLWGIGVKHSLKQWVPVLKRLPVFNLSLMAGYTRFYSGANINFLPGDIRDSGNKPAVDNTSSAVSFNDQKIDFGVGSFTANIVASADIPFITLYGGIGFNSTTTNLKMSGWYPVPVVNQSNPAIIEVTDNSAIKDPVDFRLGGNYTGARPRTTAGMKFKLAIVHLHLDYTYADYSVVSGGLGISFR
jgi:hypothetical protein